MYLSRGKFSGAATARYQGVDIASRIEGATPHQLVQILYEELLKSLDAMAFAALRGDYVKRGRHQSKSLAIITALETSLDFDKGGEIASGLVTIYREARRLVVAAGREGDAQSVVKAREMLGEIASAWEAIGRGG
jgi:flagellar secretion chaperone FliS